MDEQSRKSVVLRRPLGEDTSVMRTSALTSMMEVVRRNWSNRNLEGRFFEIAREYFPTGENQLPVERDVLCYALYGNGEDFFTAKGVAEEVTPDAANTIPNSMDSDICFAIFFISIAPLSQLYHPVQTPCFHLE